MKAAKRGFLVPVGLAIAALVPQSGVSRTSTAATAAAPWEPRSRSSNAVGRLLALTNDTRGLAGSVGHSSHSSHASHASHASHVSHVSSSGTTLPPVSVPLLPLVTGSSTPVVQTHKLIAMLTRFQEIYPPKGTHAGEIGWLTGTLRGRTLTWKLSLPKLSSPPTRLTIQLGQPGHTGAVLFQLCGANCHSGMTGKRTLSTKQASEILGGRLFANVRTTKNPTGEIRGQIRRRS